MKKLLTTLLALLLLNLCAVGQPPMWDKYKIVTQNGKQGVRSIENKKTVLPIQYDYINSTTMYRDGILVREGNICRIWNPKTGAFKTIRDSFTHRNFDRDDLIRAQIAQGDKYGFIDGDGNVIIEGQWDYVYPFLGGAARVVNGENYMILSFLHPSPGKSGLINRKGEYLIPMEYSFVDQLFDEKYRVTRFANATYDCADEFGSENPFPNGKWGLINDKGVVVLKDDTYDFIDKGTFIRGTDQLIFMVKQGAKIGVINHKGAVVFEPKEYNSVEEMFEEYAKTW